MRIGVIGAGAAGLSALKNVLEQGHECVAFEQTDNIGGTWNYTDSIGVDVNGLPVHSSMYQGLITNLPKEIMEYENFSYDEAIKESYIDHKTVLTYIKSYAEYFNLYSHIKFLRHIKEISPVSNQRWKIKEQNLETKETTEYTFDAVLICVGHYSVPRMPRIPGMELLGDRAIHSHHYRRPDSYKGKRVLVIGAGPSGIGIGKLLEDFAEKVYISAKGTIFSNESTVVHRPLVKRFEKDRAIFEDGSEEFIDNVIYCTGYQYSYPFLTPDCKITVENDWVKYLYKHIVNVHHPTMGFIGIPYKVCPFPLFDLQVRFFLEFLKNPTRFTKEEMIEDIVKEFDKKSVPCHQIHQIGMALHRQYFDDLANTLNIKRVRPVIHKLYVSLGEGRNLQKRYKIINDEEYVEIV